MNIKIDYNEIIDEFTCDLTLEMRLKRYIKKHFDIAYIISKLAPIYLVGGSIRDLINANKPKDLDFVILGNENLEWCLQVLKKFNINYSLNRFGGLKFNYDGTDIDLWTTNDLFSAMQYNVDGLFFDLKTNKLISLTFQDFCDNGIKIINSENNIEKNRKLKLIKFENKYKNLQKN